ncbi:MAG: hypothetical protein ACOYJ2_08345 [Rickettsiales bacterium]
MTKPTSKIHQNGASFPQPKFPHVDIPSIKTINEERKAFAEKLTQALACVDLTDDAQIGQLVADAQEEPRRFGIPYHPAVVAAWKAGKLMPSLAALSALKALVQGETENDWSEALDEAHEVASFHPVETKNCLTKLLMKYLNDTQGTKITQKALYHACARMELCITPEAVLTQGRLEEVASKATRYRPALSYSVSPSEDMLTVLSTALQNQYGMAEENAETLMGEYRALREMVDAFEFPPTELSVTLDAMIDASELTAEALAKALSDKGIKGKKRDGTEGPVSEATISLWRNGQARPNITTLTALDKIMAEHKVALTPLLAPLHAFEQRAEALQLWQEAEIEGDFGGMLHACRKAMGITSHKQMGIAIANHLGRVNPVTGSCIRFWENNVKLPSPESFTRHDAEAGPLECLTPATLMQEMMVAYENTMPDETRKKIFENFDGSFFNEKRSSKAIDSAFKNTKKERERLGGGKQSGSGWEID